MRPVPSAPSSPSSSSSTSGGAARPEPAPPTTTLRTCLPNAAPATICWAACWPLVAAAQELPWPGGWRGFWTVWLAAMGAAVGSFLNVVAYRLPRGESLWRPGSRCPACGHAIRPRDNLPIVGWLLLRGKCRDCHAAISPRYPVIELLCAVLWGALAWHMTDAALVPAGTSAALPSVAAFGGAIPPVAAWVWFVVAATLMSGLLVGARMVADGHRLPRALHLTVLSVAMVTPWWSPAVRPPALPSIAVVASPPRTALDASVDAAAGGAVGLMLSAVVAWSSARRGVAPLFHQRDLGALLWLGVGLGWQGAAMVTVGGLLGELWRQIMMPPEPALPWLAWVGAATMIWLWLGWQWLPEWLTLGHPRGWGALALATAATAALGWCCRQAALIGPKELRT